MYSIFTGKNGVFIKLNCCFLRETDLRPLLNVRNWLNCSTASIVLQTRMILYIHHFIYHEFINTNTVHFIIF